MPMVLFAALLLSQEAPKKEFKLGVVDLRRCFDRERYVRIKEVDAELRKLYDDQIAALAEVQKRIERLRNELTGLPREMPLYWDKLGQLQLAEADLELRKKHGRQRYVNRFNELQIEVYNEIRRVVAAYARERGFDLVLRVEEPALQGDENPQTAAAQIQSRAVLYAADGLDITGEILKILNEEHAKRRAAAKDPRKNNP